MYAILREVENRALEPSYGKKLLRMTWYVILDVRRPHQEHPIIIINHDPPFLTAKMAPLTQVTKAKVVSNHYSDSVKCFYVFFYFK